jgi:DNA recombination protein RmuC
MGFRTLAIQKHSGEVWKILGRVKTEFEKFGSVLAETQKRISQANEQLDKLVGVRTRQIQRQLEQVTAIEDVESKVMLAADNVKGEED